MTESTPAGAVAGLGEAAATRRWTPRALRGGRPWALFDVPLDAHALPALEGIRALAASLVFLVHYQAAFGWLLARRDQATFRVGEYAAAVGYHGVSIFFVLSGFLIYGSLIARPTSPARYLRRRTRRIYPTFLVVLAVYLAASWLVPSRSKLPQEGLLPYVVANALLLPGVFPIRPIVTVSWSLSFEIAFYLAIFLVVATLRLRSWTTRQRLLLWTAAFGVWAVGGPRVHQAVQSFILFVPGIFVVEVARSARLRAAVVRVPAIAIGGLVVFALLAAPLLGGEFRSERITSRVFAPQVVSTFLLSLAAGLLIFRAAADREAGWILTVAPVRRIGVVSYSFYLIHGLVINSLAVLASVMGLPTAVGSAGPVIYLLLLPPVYAAAVLAAFTLFRAVEEPLSIT